MKAISEVDDLESFDAWSGAVETKEAVIAAGKSKEFEAMIDEIYPDGVTETELNDLLWFDADFVYASLGMVGGEEE